MLYDLMRGEAMVHDPEEAFVTTLCEATGMLCRGGAAYASIIAGWVTAAECSHAP